MSRKKNFAIRSRPPLGSYEYDFVRGMPLTRPPEFPRRPKRTDADRAYDSLGSVDIVSATDFEAASRWMSNFAEQVKYTPKVHKTALEPSDLDAWSSLWKRWLLLSARKERTSDEAKQAFSVLLNEAFGLYKSFRHKGMSQVAIPYMGDLVVMLRTLPPELTLAQMVTRLHEATKAGNRLLDENTAWWQWKLRSDTTGLRRAIAAARELADKFAVTAKLKGQGTPRERGSFAYDLFMRAVTRIPIEAAGLYGIEETLRAARAEARDVLESQGKKLTYNLATLGLLAGVGYLGFKWWTRPQVNLVVGSVKPGYYPEEDHDDDEETDEGDEDLDNREGILNHA
jgi:hypothetical protein